MREKRQFPFYYNVLPKIPAWRPVFGQICAPQRQDLPIHKTMTQPQHGSRFSPANTRRWLTTDSQESPMSDIAVPEFDFRASFLRPAAIPPERPRTRPASLPQKRHRTVFISDTHLGTKGCKAELL